MLLSIAIPTYCRIAFLSRNLETIDMFLEGVDEEIEVVVSDDASPDGTRLLLENRVFKNFRFKYYRNELNIGLERNLIRAANYARGEFLWIFGDDDFIESKSSFLDVLDSLSDRKYDLFVLNRVRRNKDLSELLTDDWMGVKGEPDRSYRTLAEFLLEWGLLSVIGFITACIYRREPFTAEFDERFFGTMYPQLGMICSAFGRCETLLKTNPVICQRTLSEIEKKQELGEKQHEALFMSDYATRNKHYFGEQLCRMLNVVVERGGLYYNEIKYIKENTVCKGPLVEFMRSNIESMQVSSRVNEDVEVKKFFDHVGWP